MKIIYITEKTAIASIISDIFTFGCLFGGFFLNEYFLGRSVILEIFLCFMILIMCVGMSNRKTKKMNSQEALEFLKKNPY